MGYVFVGLTVLFTVYGQLVIKWQIGDQDLPEGFVDKIIFLLMQLLNPWIFSGFAAAFLAANCWMVAMTKLPLNKAYPFTSLALVLVLFGSYSLLGEKISLATFVGTAFIVTGLIIICQKF